MLVMLGTAHRRFAVVRRIRQDGCLWILYILGSFVLSLFWPVGLPLALFIELGLGPGKTCCGVNCNTFVQRKRNQPADQEEQAVPIRGADDQPPGQHQNMELPPYTEAIRTGER
jgi:hypothetical protein